MFAAKYEKSFDIVTNEKVTPSNQKKEVRLYFTFCPYLHSFKYDLQAQMYDGKMVLRPLKIRERERERERGGEKVRQEGTAVDPVEKALLSSFFFFLFPLHEVGEIPLHDPHWALIR